MTVARGMLVLFLMVVIGVAIVVTREESARAANRIHKLHGERTAIEQRLWKLETDMARLRGPEEIRRRAMLMGLRVVPPAARAGAASDGRTH